MSPSNFSRFSSAITAAAAALFAGGVVPAFAAEDPATETATAAKPQRDAMAKLYCVRHQHSGTRVARKTCKSRADWIKQTGVDPASK